MKKTIFNDVKIKGCFSFDGSFWVKRSSRTASVYGMPWRWFYFGKNDHVEINGN